MTALWLDRRQRSQLMSSMLLIIWKSLGEPGLVWTMWTLMLPPRRVLLSWSESPFVHQLWFQHCLLPIKHRWFSAARQVETPSVLQSSPVQCWSTFQGKKSHHLSYRCQHTESSSVNFSYFCCSGFRNVPQAVISMKQGNWDRKKVSRRFSLCWLNDCVWCGHTKRPLLYGRPRCSVTRP